MPLTEKVEFRAVLQRGNRVQIPRLIRWQFKLEPDQVLYVTVDVQEDSPGEQDFYARMTRDGRLTIPKVTLKVLQEESGKDSLVGYVFMIALKPASGVGM
jgi:bifunctional DNA-binding transcriptional regulator/antitoxin component of YhaV-PrlF toxin-antitoxin module